MDEQGPQLYDSCVLRTSLAPRTDINPFLQISHRSVRHIHEIPSNGNREWLRSSPERAARQIPQSNTHSPRLRCKPDLTFLSIFAANDAARSPRTRPQSAQTSDGGETRCAQRTTIAGMPLRRSFIGVYRCPSPFPAVPRCSF